jgi:pimeloyl-ACP methyl ester carboxylesterase
MLANSKIKGPQGGLAVYRDGAGHALPVLFLHADCGNATQWQEVMTAIVDSRLVVAVDFRGHGKSEPAADGDYSFDGRADDVGAVLDALSLERVVIVSNSAGSAVALTFAARTPDRVAGILMVDPATDPRQLPRDVREGFMRDLAGPNARDVLRGYYASIAGPNEIVRERVLADIDRVDAAARAGVGRALGDWNPELTLMAFDGPMLVLAAIANDHDGALYRLRPSIPHRIVPNTGHWIQLDQPDLVVGAVQDFVATVEGNQRG